MRIFLQIVMNDDEIIGTVVEKIEALFRKTKNADRIFCPGSTTLIVGHKFSEVGWNWRMY